ncbi:MAG TPA: SDR family NAD(P)-dependent oxidoreductase [Burkholderiaceae bacterium]|nr:SDR family NAD(P)-dependent oxidoreductase [Burkholderiaceae bacterium]
MTKRAATLVTGAAGFIGSFVAQQLLERGDTVVGVDDLNDYYDPELKRARLQRLQSLSSGSRFKFEHANIVDATAIERVFAQNEIEAVVHLAAQAGVRHSITHPQDYIDSNLTGFLNMLQAVRKRPVRHFVYASSSSVYGGNTKLPFSESDRVDRPVSLYAATKRANEQMAHVYSWQFEVPATGLRFFTVYGPWGRPDMATFRFTRAIVAGEPIDVYNHGDMQRDFTYVDDIVQGVVKVLDRVPHKDTNGVQHRVYNIGNHRSEPLMRFIDVLASAIGKKVQMRFLPMQLGDVKETFADITELSRDYGWAPTTTIDAGLPRFVDWYWEYYGRSGS